MGTKSRESIYGSSIRASAERPAEARKQADRLACEAWNQRMLGLSGPASEQTANFGNKRFHHSVSGHQTTDRKSAVLC
jgi:hypothetical protein